MKKSQLLAILENVPDDAQIFFYVYNTEITFDAIHMYPRNECEIAFNDYQKLLQEIER